MVICYASLGNDDQLLVFGLSRGNIDRLQEGRPMNISRESHGMAVPAHLKVMIFFGETEADMNRILREGGLIDPSQTVVDQRKPV